MGNSNKKYRYRCDLTERRTTISNSYEEAKISGAVRYFNHNHPCRKCGAVVFYTRIKRCVSCVKNTNKKSKGVIPSKEAILEAQEKRRKIEEHQERMYGRA